MPASSTTRIPPSRLWKVLRWGVLAAGCVLAGRLAAARWDEALIPAEIPASVRAAADEAGLDPCLVYAVVQVESKGHPRARSARGARGLMQLMPATAMEVAAELAIAYDDAALDDPAYNLRLGAAYLAKMRARFDGDETLALAAYNAGPGSVARWRAAAGASADAAGVMAHCDLAETRAYVRKVHHLARDLHARASSDSAWPLWRLGR